MNDRSTRARPLRERMRALAADAILDAAEAVFTEQGLQAGMDAIASRAGVAVGTLYNHFGDRESLILALFDARTQTLLQMIEDAAAAHADAPFREQLRAVLREFADFSEKRGAFRRMAFQADVKPPLATKLAVGEALVGRLSDVLRRGHEEGLLADDPRNLQPLMLLGLLHGATMMQLGAPERLPAADVADVVLAQFLDGAASR